MQDAEVSQADLARAVGVKPPSVNGWLSGKAKFLRGENLLAAAAALNVSQDWLATGRGPMRQQNHTHSTDANTLPGPDLRGLVPLISWVQAGDWNPAADPLLPGEAEDWLPCASRHSSSTYALRVRGDSMTAPHGNARSYPEGAIIFVDPELRSPVNGQRIIARLRASDEVTFKAYKNEDGRQWLAPLNPAHQPIHDPFDILGTVIGMWTPE